MPWVDKDMCTGCETCIEECPVGAITIVDESAQINMDNCIRCGTCHSICPENAVRHDSEKTPEIVKENILMTKKCMEDCIKYLGSPDEGQKCLKRMIKYFNNKSIIAKKTLEELESLKK